MGVYFKYVFFYAFGPKEPNFQSPHLASRSPHARIRLASRSPHARLTSPQARLKLASRSPHARPTLRQCKFSFHVLGNAWAEPSLGSVLEVSGLKNTAECTSRHAKLTDGARSVILHRVARAPERSIARSLDRSLARSFARSLQCNRARKPNRTGNFRNNLAINSNRGRLL